MYARVARWEGADGDALRRAAENIRSQSGPPPGVPATGFLMLIDPDSGRNLSIALFDTREDLDQGDQTLNSMTPDGGEEVGRRTSVEKYEVAVDIRL